MRSSAYSLGYPILAGWLFAASAGCVSSARPTPSAVIPAVPGARTPEALPPPAPAVNGPPPAPAVNGPPPAPTGPRLAWVNPARCLTACAFAPPELVRVNRLGELDARG